MRLNIKNCARCKDNHNQLFFKKFTINEDNLGYSHFAFCPTNGEPILMKIIESNDFIDKDADHPNYTKE